MESSERMWRDVYARIGERHIVCWIMLFPILFCTFLTSCVPDHDNILCFSVTNTTKDTLEITTKKIIPLYEVLMRDTIDYDPVFLVFNSEENDTVFTLPPNLFFSALTGWRTRDHLPDPLGDFGPIPGWKFIKQMKLAGKPLSPDIWNSEGKWKMSDYLNISREYKLEITE